MKILDALEKKFPNCWFKDGNEFDGSSAAAWSGEGSGIDGMPAFDSYASGWDPEETMYVMGVKKELADFVKSKGYFWEAYDSGTYLLYRA
jgi:hypothetical protein